MTKRLKSVDLYKIYRSWTEGTGVFRCFFRSTNFVSLKHYPDFELSTLQPADDGNISQVLSLINKYDIDTTLIIIDLPGKLSLDVAYRLQMTIGLKPILVFNGILHPFGLIGDTEYISKLLGYGELLATTKKQGFAFVLDSQRFGEYSDDQLKNFFNNQYELSEEDLPSAEMLKQLGYNAVACVFQNPVKEDLECYLAYLSGSDVLVYKEELEGEAE